MAGFDADEIIVAPFGHVYVAPVGTAQPSTIASSLNAAWIDLGYLSENGISGTFGVETTDIRAWQAETPVRRIITSRTGEISFELMEWSKDSVELAFGGGTWTEDAGDLMHYVFPTADNSISEKALLFDVEDGLTHLMFCFERCTLSGGGSFQFVRGAAAVLPVTLGLLANETTGAVGKIVGTQDTAS